MYGTCASHRHMEPECLSPNFAWGGSENLAYIFFTPVFGRVLYYGCDLCHAGAIQALITHKPSLAKPPLLDIEGTINRR